VAAEDISVRGESNVEIRQIAAQYNKKQKENMSLQKARLRFSIEQNDTTGVL